ncbi:hypothetical protein NM73696_2212 [Neisseria meningitidis 73696]|nr:hypothetical protein NM73696_2212 [Neisseria meningitidis 73696]
MLSEGFQTASGSADFAVQKVARAFVLRQQPRQGGEVCRQLFRQQIGRIDDEHSAAVHTETVGFRRVDVKFGVKVVVGQEFFQFFGQLAAFFAAEAGIPNEITAGLKPF